MSCYVDDMEAPFGRMAMCHLIADSTKELLAMVHTIGVDERWIQHQGTYKEHFDICKSKRLLAVQAGAIEITQMELVRKLVARRRHGQLQTV